jgi:carbonic anhydrase
MFNFQGPEFWNFLHKDWRMCADGQLQSPVNIDPGRLLFDPSLQPLRFSQKQVIFL